MENHYLSLLSSTKARQLSSFSWGSEPEQPSLAEREQFIQLRVHNRDMEMVRCPKSDWVEHKEDKAPEIDSRVFVSESGQLKPCSIHLGTSEVATKVRSFSFKVGGRETIKEFTRTSRDRLRFKIRNSFCVWTCLTTLTYPKRFPKDGRLVKKHLNTFLTALRRDYPGVRYLWWLEFQERGAPHIHSRLALFQSQRT